MQQIAVEGGPPTTKIRKPRGSTKSGMLSLNRSWGILSFTI